MASNSPIDQMLSLLRREFLPADNSVILKVGTVSGVDTTLFKATVTWAVADDDPMPPDPTVGIPWLSSYWPIVGHRVYVAISNGSPFILGRAAGSAPASQEKVGCTIRRVAALNIPNVTPTTVTWDTEDYDPFGFIAVPSTTVTIPAGLGGTYAATFYDSGTFGGRSFVQIAVTAVGSPVGSVPTNFRSTPDAVAASFGTAGIPTIPLAAGDSLTCTVFQSSGAAVNHTGWLSLTRTGS